MGSPYERIVKKQTGFSIVELLVILVVIGVLALIIVMTYNNAQRREAADSVRKSEVSTIAQAVELYIAQEDDQLLDGSAGCGDHGAGYWAGQYGSNPSLYDCVSSTVAPDIPKYDPGGRSYMKANCIKDGQQVSYILTDLTSKSQSTGFMESICDSPPASGAWSTIMSWDAAYGMDYAVQIRL